MKKLIVLLLWSAIGFAQNNYTSKITKHRAEINQHFKDAKKSPLPKKKLKNFKTLPYFKIKPNYKVKAKLNYTFNSPITYIKNTAGKNEAYEQYALASFTINGEKMDLPIYQSLTLKGKRGYENYLFIPFTDNSNGKTTYSGGRYLDTLIPEKPTGYIILDFNKAYNPYCAYNPKYTCPIPPKKNHLNISISAGVKY